MLLVIQLTQGIGIELNIVITNKIIFHRYFMTFKNLSLKLISNLGSLDIHSNYLINITL